MRKSIFNPKDEGGNNNHINSNNKISNKDHINLGMYNLAISKNNNINNNNQNFQNKHNENLKEN